MLTTILLSPAGAAETQAAGGGACCILAFLVGFAMLYVAAAAFVAGVLRGQNIERVRFWDPLVLTASERGKADLALLQTFCFAVIIAGLAGYAWVSSGSWPQLSANILGLLGIPLGAGALGKLMDAARNRLADEDWFIKRGWLPPRATAEINKASWRDLFTSDGAFDVYRFQSLIVGLVLAAALLTGGSTDLTHFAVPEGLLAILGVSQGIYVAGKMVEPPSRWDLHKATDELIKLEADFITSAFENPDPSDPSAFGAPADLSAAIRRAGADKYSAYVAKGSAVRTMFKSVMGMSNVPPFEPRYRS